MFDDLIAEYGEFLKENKLPEQSADELVWEVKDEDAEGDEVYLCTPEQREWLFDFINRWEEAADKETEDATS